MFSLAYPIDDTAVIDGTTYTIDMSFDNILRLIDMLNDENLNDAEQIIVGLEMLLGVNFLLDIETQYTIFSQIFEKHVAQGAKSSQAIDIEGNPMPKSEGDVEEEFYSLKEDAEYIYSSFIQCYGMDLHEQQGELHWSKFKALLGGLSEDTKFMKVIDIRTCDLPKGKGSEKDRTKMKKLKEIYALKGDDSHG